MKLPGIKLYSFLTILIILSACSGGSKTNSESDYEEDEYTEYDEAEIEEYTTDEEPSFEISINDQTGNANYELRSSNAIGNEKLATTLNIYWNDELYEEFPFDLSLAMISDYTSAELSTGSYPVKGYFDTTKFTTKSFELIGDFLDQSLYKSYLEANATEEIAEEYVFLSEENNFVTIDSADKLGSEEDSKYYVEGSQSLSGKLELHLYQIATKKEITITANYDMQHDWTLSKSSDE
ncbi:hypothetical protein [Marinoscillum pacificum]|uniref:hypothetical protein n=1 Tax=Marinoscillum pacificum TaxID=392723 RepID=UPI002157281D|nr:hypothetical protein [Marinoscillum pacificum]